MIIRKLFKFEGAHIVRDCSSDYCKKSIHGHSYKVEIFLESKTLDHGMMVLDFGLLKGTVKDLVESFDHAWSYWNKESDDYKKFVQANSERWIEMPISPSAEGYALLLFYHIARILENTIFNNGEGDVHLKSVRVHETETGYAEAFEADVADAFWKFNLGELVFSPSIMNDWKNPQMMNDIDQHIKFTNPIVERKFK